MLTSIPPLPLAAQIVMKNGVRLSPLGYNLVYGEDILQSTAR